MTVDVVRILVTQTYGIADLLLDLQVFYIKAAVKPGSPSLGKSCVGRVMCQSN